MNISESGTSTPPSAATLTGKTAPTSTSKTPSTSIVLKQTKRKVVRSEQLGRMPMTKTSRLIESNKRKYRLRASDKQAMDMREQLFESEI